MRLATPFRRSRTRTTEGAVLRLRDIMTADVVSVTPETTLRDAADLRIVPDAGHSAFEPGNVHQLISATDRFRERTQ